MCEFENPLMMTVYVVIPKKMNFQEEFNLINPLEKITMIRSYVRKRFLALFKALSNQSAYVFLV